MTGKARSR